MKCVCRCIVRCGAVVLRHVSLVSKDLDYSYRISLIPKCKPRAWCVDRVASVRGGCPHFECAGREARRDADGAAIICHADCIDVLPFSTPLLNLQRWCSGVCRLRDAGYRKDQPFPRHHRRCSPQHSWLWCTGSKSHGGEQEHPIKNVSHSFVYYFGNKKDTVHSASKRFLTCAGIWGEMGRAGTVLCAVCFSFWVTFYYILSHKSELLVPPASYDPACHDIADELQCRKSWKGCTWVSSNAQGSSRCFQPGLPIIQSSTIYISQNEINIPSE